MTLLRAALLIIVFAVSPVSEAASWGASGHSIIAEIAQRRLDPQAARKIREPLGENVSLPSVASWADDLAMLRPDTARSRLNVLQRVLCVGIDGIKEHSNVRGTGHQLMQKAGLGLLRRAAW